MGFSFLVSVSHSALPIKRCLDLGADIVVTGRCVDSAVVLGPLMHSVRFVMQKCSSDFLCNRYCDSFLLSNDELVIWTSFISTKQKQKQVTHQQCIFSERAKFTLASTGRLSNSNHPPLFSCQAVIVVVVLTVHIWQYLSFTNYLASTEPLLSLAFEFSRQTKDFILTFFFIFYFL